MGHFSPGHPQLSTIQKPISDGQFACLHHNKTSRISHLRDLSPVSPATLNRPSSNLSCTLLSIIAVLCGCQTEHGSKRRSSLISLMAAFLQLLTAPIVVGWIWSVLWGITFVNISVSRDMEETTSGSML